MALQSVPHRLRYEFGRGQLDAFLFVDSPRPDEVRNECVFIHVDPPINVAPIVTQCGNRRVNLVSCTPFIALRRGLTRCN